MDESRWEFHQKSYEISNFYQGTGPYTVDREKRWIHFGRIVLLKIWLQIRNLWRRCIRGFITMVKFDTYTLASLGCKTTNPFILFVEM